MSDIKPCPFCGHEPRRDNLEDSLHPLNRERTLWTFSCLDNEGGCNASVLGNSAEECVKLWNTRALSSAEHTGAQEIKRLADLYAGAASAHYLANEIQHFELAA
jgi:hypothetical protein